MKRWIILLRGVMPTGKNKLSMPALREALEAAGFARVRTWITSGNVLVDTLLNRQQTRDKIHQLLLDEMDVDLAVIVKDAEEIQAALRNNPFAELDGDRIFYGFFNEQPEQDKAQALQAQDFGEERLAIGPAAVYMFIPGSAARSKLGNAFLQRKLGIELTFRNRNTLHKLMELASDS